MEIETLIGNYAFPIIVSLWFMFKTEKAINANTAATQEMISILRAEQEKEKGKSKAA